MYAVLLNATFEVITASLLVNPHAITKPTNLEDPPGSNTGTLDSRHAFRLQLLVSPLDGPVSGRQTSKREDDDPESHLPRFVDSDQGAVAVFDNVKEQRPGCEFLDRLGSLLFAPEAFEQADVGAELAGGV